MIVSVIFLGLFVFGETLCQNDIDCVKPYNELLSCGSSSQCSDSIVNNVEKSGICNNNRCTWICVTDDDCPVKPTLDSDYTKVCVSGSIDHNLNNKCYLRDKNFNCVAGLCTQTSEIPAPIIGGDYNEDGSVNCIDAFYMREDLSRNRGVFQSRVAVFSDMLGINSFIVSLFNNYNSFTLCTWRPQFVD